MSILFLPRLYFQGEISWNPDTANNSNPYYDENTDSVNLSSPCVTYDTFKTYMMAIKNGGNIRSGWNYFGDHGCEFVNDKTLQVDGKPFVTSITGGTLPDGTYVNQNDPIITQPVQILGNTFGGQASPPRLVDVDPYSVNSSQIFFDKVSIGGGDIGITGPRHCRMYSHWINFERNLNTTGDLIIAGIASVVWQTSIPFKQLEVTTGDSQLLIALNKAMQGQGTQGLMLQFGTYRTLYYQNGIRNSISQQPRNGQELSELYLKGEVFPNPAYSKVVGVIGVWNTNEPASVPTGRFLAATKDKAQPSTKSLDPVLLGPLVAAVDSNRQMLTLDLNSTFPELNNSAEKVDFGPVKVQAITDDNQTIDITTLNYQDYDKQAYEKQAGIVDLTLNEKQLTAVQKGLLALATQDCHGNFQTVLEEQPYTALTDDRGLYLNEETTQSCVIQVQHKGQIPPTGTQVLIAQYNSLNGNLINKSSYTVVDTTDLVKAKRYNRNMQPIEELLSEKDSIPPVMIDGQSGPVVVSVDSNGKVTIQLSPNFSTCCNIVFFPFQGDRPKLPSQVSFEAADYTCVRVLPFDNQLAKTPDNQLTWPFIYDNTLRVYDLIYPIMSEVVPLNNRTRVEGMCLQIQKMVNPEMFESTLYMPITRDLSAGKIKLLQRWCNLVSRDKTPD